MDELSSNVREIVERSATPVTAEEAVTRAGASGAGRRWVLVAAIVALVAAVGGLALYAADGKEDDQPAPFADTTLTTIAAIDLPEPGDCIEPASGTQAAVQSLIRIEGLSVQAPRTVQSDDDDYENLFFISAEVDGKEFDGTGHIATWAANFSGLSWANLTDTAGAPPSIVSQSATIVPVNALAEQISDGVGGLKVPSMTTDGALESQACVLAIPVQVDEVVSEDAVEIPDLTGKSEIEAANALGNLGFEVAFFEERHDTVEEGHVVRTEPVAGELLAPGGVVTVTISTGKEVRVPNVVGLTAEEAIAVMRGAELNVSIESQQVPLEDSTDGKVISQNPAADTEVEKGATVVLGVGITTG